MKEPRRLLDTGELQPALAQLLRTQVPASIPTLARERGRARAARLAGRLSLTAWLLSLGAAARTLGALAAIGGSVGLAATLSRPQHAPVTVGTVAPSQRAAESSQPSKVAAAATPSAAKPTKTAPGHSLPRGPLSERQALRSPRRPPDARLPRPRHAPDSTPAVVRSDATAGSRDALTRELELLERVRSDLKTDPLQALAGLDAYQTSFPRGQLASEARVLRIEALDAAGRGAEARSMATEVLQTESGSLYGERVRGTLSSTEGNR